MAIFKTFGEYLTEASTGVVFTFGRFNPPTVGHEKLLDVVAKAAKGGDEYRVYSSQSQDKKKNPLDYNSKIKYMLKESGTPDHLEKLAKTDSVPFWTSLIMLTKKINKGNKGWTRGNKP
jgi:phosphopantetheine adenylyltransferase